MARSANASRKQGASSGRNARNASVKRVSSTTMEDIDPIVQPSQSSSDDGMIATIAQQMQASVEKKKKEREAKFLQAAQMEFEKLLAEKAHELTDGVAEIERIYADFKDAYAANEDYIRKLWDAILNEQMKLQKHSEERHKMTLDREKRREKEHIQALAHCRKSCEESQRLIDSLGPNYEQS